MGSDTRTRAATLNGVVLTKATAEDLADVAAMERVCYGDPWPAAAFSSLPENPQVFFAVAREGGHGPIAGYVVAWYILDEGELANLAVSPGLRKRGLGRLMLDAMLEDARGRGTATVYLEVRESNVAARQLYATRAFEEVGRRKQYYRNPSEDALILRRTLAPGLR